MKAAHEACRGPVFCRCQSVNNYIILRGVFKMKKTYKLRDLDCANCAQKMEEAIRKVEGVEDASVNFMLQKMTVTADEAKMDEIMKKIVKVCKKVEPDCEILL